MNIRDRFLSLGNFDAVNDNGRVISIEEVKKLARNIQTNLPNNQEPIVILMNKSWQAVSAIMGCLISNDYFIYVDPENIRAKDIINEIKPSLILIKNESKGFEEFTNTLDILKISLRPEKNYKQGEKAYTYFTSGSSGKPKGVLVSHKGIFNVIDQQILKFEMNHSRSYFFIKMDFDASLSDILCSIFSKSTLYINDAVKKSASSLIKYFNENSISHVDISPSFLNLIDPSGFKTLKVVIIGGEVPSKEMVRKYSKILKLINVYGPTECTICTSMIESDENWEEPCIGNPIEGMNYKVVDSSLNNVLRGNIGELLISGVGVGLGYVNNLELTKERFILIDNIYWYKTGDLVKNINNYPFVSRIDRQIKNNGQLVILEDIEANLLNNEQVKRAAVIFKDKKMVLFYEGDVSEKECREFLSNKLPSYMIPSKIIKVNNIPETSSGKINYKELENPSTKFLSSLAIQECECLIYGHRETKSNNCLILGSTGFLGTALIKELYDQYDKIYLLIREDDISKAKIKFENSCLKNKINISLEKIDIILGNGDSLLDLNLDVSDVFHLAAQVNNLKNIYELWDDNVLLTKQVLQYVLINGSKLYYASTLSVKTSIVREKSEIVEESPLVGTEDLLYSGYAQSKWVAEYIVAEVAKKYPHIWIYRFGLLTENQNVTKLSHSNFLTKTIEKISKIEAVPNLDLSNYKIDITPIDYAAHYVKETLDESPSIFNVSANISLSVEDILSHFPIKNKIDLSKWNEIYQRKMIYRFLSTINSDKRYMNYSIVETTNVIEYKQNISIKYKIREDIKSFYIKGYSERL